MPTTALRAAATADVPLLLQLMHGYYQDDALAFDVERAEATLRELLAQPHWGRVWLVIHDEQVIGYVAVCLGFSLELGGHDAFVDELFVLPPHRGRGHGRRVVELAALEARKLGVRALHLEVDRGNVRAQRLYDALGFGNRDRYLVMTKPLA
jgi:ribosomal protein S18 acetylase RimI-like enzyme